MNDLDEAVRLLWRAAALTPEYGPKSLLLADLGIVLLSRFERFGKPGDLHCSTCINHRTVKTMPDTVDSLAIDAQHQLCRYRHSGELYYLEGAIILGQRALDHMPDGDSEKPDLLRLLADALSCRFEHLDEPDDLVMAILLLQQAVVLVPDKDPVKSTVLNNLAICYRQRSELLVDTSLHSTSVRLKTVVQIDKLRRLVHLVSPSIVRVERMNAGEPGAEPQDDQWTFNLQQNADFVIDHPDPIEKLLKLFALADLMSAISMYQRVIELEPDASPAMPMLFYNLAQGLLSRFVIWKNDNDLEDAISASHRAIVLCPDGHDRKATYLALAGRLMHRRFELTKQYIDLECAISSLKSAVQLGSVKPFMRINMLISLCIFSSPETLLLAHSCLIHRLSELVWLGDTVQRRYAHCARLGDHVTSAVSAAIEHGFLLQAMEWLECGRALVWSQILALRTPLDSLAHHHPDLAQALRDLHRKLEHLSPIALSGAPNRLDDRLAYSAFDKRNISGADQLRGLVLKYELVLEDIRCCKGFEDFLLPKKFSTLASSIELSDMRGPVVFINVESSRCDALVLCPRGSIHLVPLPALTKKRADSLRVYWIQTLRTRMVRERAVLPRHEQQRSSDGSNRLFAYMWTCIARPVLQALGLIRFIPAGERLPHITWCLAGPLAQLPLHAAGIYDPLQQPAPRIFDFIVSSYTPSFSMFLQCRRNVVNHIAPNVLVLTQPETPGQSPLPGTIDESRRICAVLKPVECRVLEREQATVASTLAIIDQYPWVHFACHASQSLSDSTQSALELHDGPLTLSALMSTASENAELAFLSACQTATGDDRVPEESVHLAAGMLAVGFKGVIATMWSIRDADAPVVVEGYYKKLIALRKTGAVGNGETGAAYALHEAMKCLREKVGETSFERWVPFVHFGV
ncbi:hypothetical protein PENSPDRAFT_610026 [Peniophora sp. CONT]|nr:hypothetical protein PENSPDRAFT_610026 [Peniophora sp. CONT]